jgi:hypothetical protein
VHVEAIGADTGLAAIAVFRCDGASDGRIQIRIVEDDEGRIAAEGLLGLASAFLGLLLGFKFGFFLPAGRLVVCLRRGPFLVFLVVY